MKSVLKTAMFLACGLLIAAPAWADGVRIGNVLDPVVVSDPGNMVRISMDEPGESAEPAAPMAPEPGKKEKKHKKVNSDWGGFGGAMIQYIQLDLSPLEPMTKDRKVDEFNDQMLLIGGIGGMIYKDFRFGGFGFGNSQDVANEVAGHRRSADMSFGGGGIFFELNHAFSPNFGLAGGSLIGVGAMNLSATGPDLGPDEKWSQDSSFFMAYPYLGFWLAPVKFMWVQFDAGWLYFDLGTGSSQYENDLGVKMVDGDLMGGFSAGVKINFGYNPNK